MVTLVQRLRYWLADEAVIYECRNCGMTLDEQHDTCPDCGVNDIACYDIK